jgi:hypothetical protein
MRGGQRASGHGRRQRNDEEVDTDQSMCRVQRLRRDRTIPRRGYMGMAVAVPCHFICLRTIRIHMRMSCVA